MEEEYGVCKEPSSMTKEERLIFGGNLVERKSDLLDWRAKINILKDHDRSPLNIYDVVFYGTEKDISASTGSLTAAKSEAFSLSMKEAAQRRWDRLIEFQLSIVNEQITEVECEIENL